MPSKSRARFSGFIAAAFCALGGLGASAAELRVPQDFPTIQAAIDAAQNGDEVVVSPGTYFENLELIGVALTLRSTDGPLATTIDGEHSDRVFKILGDGPGVVAIDGFTITHGFREGTNDDGGGMYARNARIEFIDCIIIENVAEGGGDGLFFEDCEFTIDDCLIALNEHSSIVAVNYFEGVDECRIRNSVIADSIFLDAHEDANDCVLEIRDTALERPIGVGDHWIVHYGPGMTDRIPAMLTSVSVALGQLVSGGVAELWDSDDTWLITRSQLGFAANEPNVLDVRITAQNLRDEQDSLDVHVESRLNNPGGTSKLRLRNQTTGAFTLIAQDPIGTSEIIQEVANLDPALYVDGDTEEIELSVRQSVFATFSAAGFRSFIDHVRIRTW